MIAPMRGLWIGVVAVVLSQVSALAEPVTQAVTLDPDGQTFGTAAFQIVEVVTDQPTQMMVRADGADVQYIPYFQTARHLNDEIFLGNLNEASYAQGFDGGVTPAGINGTWLFIVYAEWLEAPVKAQVQIDNAVIVRTLAADDVAPFDLVAAFRDLGIVDAQIAAQTLTPWITYALAVPYVRQTLTNRYAGEVILVQSDLDDIQSEIVSTTERLRQLEQALIDAENTGVSRDLIVADLKIKVANARGSLENLNRLGQDELRVLNGLKRDVVLLREIDDLKDQSQTEALFLRDLFAREFVANLGQISVQMNDNYNQEAPEVLVTLPRYPGSSEADILLPPVEPAPVVEEPASWTGLEDPQWNPDDWNGSAFVKQDEILRATHRVVLDRALLQQAARDMLNKDSVDTLGEAADLLSNVLRAEGFADLSFQGIEEDATGFLLATGLEQTDSNGIPLAGEARYSSTVVKIKDRSISGYLRALFTAEPGYFRVILFLVSTQQFTNDGPDADFQTLQGWSDKSLKGRLPTAVGDRAFSDDHSITALIYEFRKTGQPQFLDKTQTNLQASAHFDTTATLKNHLVR